MKTLKGGHIMKLSILVIFVLFLLATSNIFADDVSIDSNGNVKTGVANPIGSGNLDVTGASGEHAVRGVTSGTGAAGVFGENNDVSGYGGYFQGNARVTGNLTVDGSVSGPNIGDITGVTAGTGLSGGGTSGSVTLNANTTYLQRRVSNSCTVGSSIRAINEDGSISCETDDVGITSESDPKVGSNTANYVPKWNGSALVTGSIYDSGTIGIGAVNTNSNIKLYVHRQPNDSGAGKVSIYGYRTGLSGEANGGTGWNEAGVDTAIKGYNLWGNQFTSGIAGYSDLDYASSAAVVGAKSDGSNRGILGYKDINNDLWAGYFEGDVKVNGGVTFADSTVQTTAAAPTWSQKLTCDVGNCPRFQVLADFNNEAVLDRETGLVWEKSPSTDTYNWSNALIICAERNVGGRMGWHLPTIEQLASLVDKSVGGSPKLPTGHPFIGVQSDFVFYWSATTYSFYTTDAKSVDFSHGWVGYANKTTDENYIWCVRGGQSHDTY
jgi:hypothetical protein